MLTNPGFDTGLTGWTTTAASVSSTDDADGCPFSGSAQVIDIGAQMSQCVNIAPSSRTFGAQRLIRAATVCLYDAKAARYGIRMRYLFYDVFGLDDDDLEGFGAMSDSAIPQKVGITAWWQLQHQHGFAPLVTRIVVERSFEAPAS